MVSSDVRVQGEKREHFATDRFVSDPEDEIVSELYCLDHVWEGEQKGAEAIDIHGESVKRVIGNAGNYFRCPLSLEAAAAF